MPKKYIVILDYYDDWDKFLVVETEVDLLILNNKDEQEMEDDMHELYMNYIGNVHFDHLLDDFPVDTLREDAAVIRIYI